MQADFSFMSIQRMEIRAQLVIEVPQRRDKTPGHTTECLWSAAHHGPIRYAALGARVHEPAAKKEQRQRPKLERTGRALACFYV